MASKMPQRPAQPGLLRGRLQRTAFRAFYGAEEVTTTYVASLAYPRKAVLTPDDYKSARRALRTIGAVRIARAGGMGSPLIWRLKRG
jgi:hypothetical protein